MIAASTSRGSFRAIPWDRNISRGRGFSRRSNKEFIQFLFIVHPVKYMRTFLFHGAGVQLLKFKASCTRRLIWAT